MHFDVFLLSLHDFLRYLMDYFKTKPGNFAFFLSRFLHSMLVYGCILFVFCIFRIIIWIGFEPPGIDGLWIDVCKAFFYGFLFDTKTAFYCLAPVIIYNTAGLLFTSPATTYYCIYDKISRIYYAVLIILFLYIAIVDFCFLNYYKTHISVFIFGFIEDDTRAITKTIWDEYPVITAHIGMALIGLLFYLLIGFIQKRVSVKVRPVKLPAKIGVVVLCWTLILAGGRGSLSYYPLKPDSSVVSVNSSINNLVLNGVYALHDAYKDRKMQKIHVNIEKSLKSNGFSSPEEAISRYTNTQISGHPDSLLLALYDRTPADSFLQSNPPNVVFIMMESMGEFFLSLHDTENLNLLGSLEDVLPECIRFTHFLPAVSSTIYSLECLLVKNVMEPISHSIYVNRTMETSSVKPFKEKGYQTTFITGSKLGWRNMDEFIPRQYFDNVEGRANLEFHIKNTTSSDWGAYDEFLFERILNMLNEQNGTPQFVFAMTTSNHPPYTYPSTYHPLPVKMPDQIKYAHTSGSSFTQKHMISYQYANDCLGNFIKTIKASPLGENTIIAITGDHNARAVFDFSDTNPIDKYGVPFILYIPEKYKRGMVAFDADCFGSHKDVFPTIYHLALSDAAYIKSGVNLLDRQQTDTNFGITDNNVIITRNGCIRFEMKPVYYVWADSSRTGLKPATEKDIPALQHELMYGKSYLASMTYLIQRCLLEK